MESLIALILGILMGKVVFGYQEKKRVEETAKEIIRLTEEMECELPIIRRIK